MTGVVYGWKLVVYSNMLPQDGAGNTKKANSVMCYGSRSSDSRQLMEFTIKGSRILKDGASLVVCVTVYQCAKEGHLLRPSTSPVCLPLAGS